MMIMTFSFISYMSGNVFLQDCFVVVVKFMFSKQYLIDNAPKQDKRQHIFHLSGFEF